MIAAELYEDADAPLAVIERDGAEDLGAWARLQECLARGVVGGTPARLDVRADVFLSELNVLRDIRRLYGTELALGERLQRRLRRMADDRREREAALTATPIDPRVLLEELEDAGFTRELRPFQVANVTRIATFPHAADFSVPGAGKTAVALANFAVQRRRGVVQRLLVVAPLAAFASWREEADACFDDPPTVAVHLGAGVPLPSAARILLTNYHRLASDYDRLRAWVSRVPTHVILDEAHRVKRGRSGVHGTAALDLAFAARRRDVLTGTPAPQGAHDLVALMKYLYPGQARQILPSNAFVERLGRNPDVLAETHRAVQRYFVRTCKGDLGLPPTTMEVLSQPMGPVQAAIYSALIGQYRARFGLSDGSRRWFRRLGRIVMYLLEAATNPLLLGAGSDEDDLAEFEHPPLELTGNERVADLLTRYGDFETPWKYGEVERLVQEAAAAGDKILVWSTFVRSIRYLQRALQEWNPAVVHGGIPPRDGASPNAQTTREDELDRFRYDPACSVLLANPAACGEGVSLHHWCHHAVYLDRSFNAGHFLQSQDRIHRLGLAEGTETRFTILVSEGSVDEFVNHRLIEKVSALAQLMDDRGLVQLALPETDDDAIGAVAAGLDSGDVQAILRHIGDPPA